MRRRKPPYAVRLAQDQVWHDYQMSDRYKARSDRPGKFWADVPSVTADHLQEVWYGPAAQHDMNWDQLSKGQRLYQQRKADANYRRI